MTDNRFLGKKILILPYSAVGDLTIYIRLARNFVNAGSIVTIESDILFSAREKLSWLAVAKGGEYQNNGSHYDLVIAHYRNFYKPGFQDLCNVAFVSAKPISLSHSFYNKSVILDGVEYKKASRAFCRDTRSGMSMVQWVDEYCRSVFFMETAEVAPEIDGQADCPNRILVFPLSPHRKKNYWLVGFKFIYRRLLSKGWNVEFVCSPTEYPSLSKAVPGYKVLTFETLDALLAYVSGSALVISNDSGGGHLASLCGVKTYTITRRDKNFSWRPGFTSEAMVVGSIFKFKLFGFYIWRPFIPLWRILRDVGSYKAV